MDSLMDIAHTLWVGGKTAPPGEVLYAVAGPAANASRNWEPQKMQVATLPLLHEGWTRCVCVSDLHEKHRSVDIPPGDLLLVAGDLLLINRHFSTAYSEHKLADIADWMRSLQFKHKVLIGGNHDAAMEALGVKRIEEIFHGCTYLLDSGFQAGELFIWGTPYSQGDSNNNAFQSGGANHLSTIPEKCDILLTHGPLPKDVLHAKNPRVHVSGHIHCKYGVRLEGKMLCVNASIMDGRYNPSHVPIVVDIQHATSSEEL
jgi:Icc-related predicted phosphoesterase